MDLQVLLKAIDQLPPDELDRLKRRVEERQGELQANAHRVAEQMAALDSAVAEFREGLSDEKLSELLAAMNVKQID